MNVELTVFILFLFYYVVCQSIWGIVKFRKSKIKLLQGGRNKLKFFLETLLNAWLPTILLLLVVIFSDITYQDLGLNRIKLHTNKWLTYPILIMICLYTCYLIYQTIVLRICAVKGNKVKIKISDEVAAILPDTKKEKILYAVIAFSAGITEEILFRGYLMYALQIFLPGLHIGYILMLSALVFGIAHLYQGVKSILTTGMIGFIYGLIYMVSGSIVPNMIFHFIQDVSAIDFKTVRITEETDLLSVNNIS